MTDKINGRTPEEIKKGLECFITQDVNGCDDEPCEKCICYAENSAIGLQAVIDGQALIQQLEAERDQYKRERDAYLSGMKGVCVMCKRRDYCLLDPLPSCVRWQWRGVQGVE